MSIIKAVRGTRDFYPEDMASRQWLYGKIREVSESFGYQEYDGPFLERLELYAAKSGEELVNEQSYVFADRNGTMITLRPELTLSLARMIAQRSKALIPPLRWWSFGPFWRYERTQKGRSREFFQWNIDLIGVLTFQAAQARLQTIVERVRHCDQTSWAFGIHGLIRSSRASPATANQTESNLVTSERMRRTRE